MLWGDLFEKPVFVLTSDQDWAPSWASRVLLDKAAGYGVPIHCFRTNPCPELDKDAALGKITQGWHPNFLTGSSHGSSPAEVVQYMKQHFPGARTARSHTFLEGTYLWTELARAGIIADSQCVTLYQPELVPLLHWTKIVRLPVFFEDDVFFEYEGPELDLKAVMKTLFTPGLKIFNFHATFVACNITDRVAYEHAKPRIFGTESPASGVISSGRGTASVFDEILTAILESGYQFISMESLVDMVMTYIKGNSDKFPETLSKLVLQQT